MAARIFAAAVLLYVTYIELKFIWEGIRSIMKKPLNLPPSKLRWAKVDVRSEREDTKVYYDDSDYGAVFHNGVPITSRTQSMKTLTARTVAYEYGGQMYRTTIRKKGASGYGTQVYCKKSDPSVTRVYTPAEPKNVPTGLSLLFIAACIVFLEVVAITQML